MSDRSGGWVQRLKRTARAAGVGPRPPWERVRWSPRQLAAAPRTLDVLFSVRNPYQIGELAGVNRALDRAGLKTGFLDHSLDGGSPTAAQAGAAGLRVWNLRDFAQGNLHPSVLVVRTDSDKCSRRLLEHARQAGVTTAALAHPLINFGRKPNQYRLPDHVWCTGAYTAERIRRDDLEITGFPYFDPFLSEPSSANRSLLAVINVALPRGLLHDIPDMDDHRVEWVGQALDASRALGLEPVVSVHPRDPLPVHDWPVRTGPIEPLLPDAAVAISPPSTVIYTAMAMGTPVACHQCPPVRERMPAAFDEPLGAFEVSESTDELKRSLDSALASQANYRERSRPFFSHHVSVDPDQSMTDRTAGAVMRLVQP